MEDLILENKKLIPLYNFILALSNVFGSIWIGNSLNNAINTQINNKEKALLTEKESSEYLNISIDRFKKDIRRE